MSNGGFEGSFRISASLWCSHNVNQCYVSEDGCSGTPDTMISVRRHECKDNKTSDENVGAWRAKSEMNVKIFASKIQMSPISFWIFMCADDK